MPPVLSEDLSEKSALSIDHPLATGAHETTTHPPRSEEKAYKILSLIPRKSAPQLLKSTSLKPCHDFDPRAIEEGTRNWTPPVIVVAAGNQRTGNVTDRQRNVLKPRATIINPQSIHTTSREFPKHSSEALRSIPHLHKTTSR